MRLFKEKSIAADADVHVHLGHGFVRAYNANLLRMAGEVLDPQDPMIVIGTKGTSTLRQKGFNLIREPIGSDHVDFYVFNDLADEALKLYVSGEIGKIQILYCQFVNAVTFTPAAADAAARSVRWNAKAGSLRWKPYLNRGRTPF